MRCVVHHNLQYATTTTNNNKNKYFFNNTLLMTRARCSTWIGPCSAQTHTHLYSIVMVVAQERGTKTNEAQAALIYFHSKYVQN